MSKLNINLIAVTVGMSIASPAFAQTQDRSGSVPPYHYEGETQAWTSYAQGPTTNSRRAMDMIFQG
jgi:hypothetical protein